MAALRKGGVLSLTVPIVFDQIARRFPSRSALSMGATRMTYAELAAWSEQIADRLLLAGVVPRACVGVFVERSFAMVAATIAVLRVGAVYVPVDPGYPDARIQFILQDADVRVVLAQPGLVTRLEGRGLTILEVSGCGDDLVGRGSDPRGMSNRMPVADDPAYIMYTSGSTGQPKGVVVPHRGIVRLVCGADFFEVSPEDVFLQLAPSSFDASTFEIWGALLNGATLEIMPPGQPSLEEIGNVLQRARVTILWLTSGLFNLMVDERLAALSGVHQLLAGGDVLSVAHVRRALHALPSTRIINGYGPTENTTFTCCHTIPRDLPDGGSVPIGRAIRGTTVHIVDPADPNLCEVADGSVGELVTGGQGVALGYWRRPELTQERFIPDRFSASPGALLYRTGDRARRLPDGTVEFLGRADDQVKIRGYRIELGEIEDAVRKHPMVNDCAVKVSGGAESGKRISCFLVLKDRQAGVPSDLVLFLGGSLPSYMLPDGWSVVDRLPLSPNGKVDRAALPEQDQPAAEEDDPSALSELERLILGVAKGVMAGRPVSVELSFFDMGADSLVVAQIHERLGRLHGVRIPLTDMFQFPSIRRLAAHLGRPTAAGAGEPSDDRTRLRKAAMGRFRRPQGGGD